LVVQFLSYIGKVVLLKVTYRILDGPITCVNETELDEQGEREKERERDREQDNSTRRSTFTTIGLIIDIREIQKKKMNRSKKNAPTFSQLTQPFMRL